MRTLNLFATALFAVLCLVALTAQGCSKAGDRTLTIFQMQSVETHAGSFSVDTSGLPADAIDSQSESGDAGSPLTTLHLNMDYEFDIILRVQPRSDGGDIRGAGSPDASE